MGWNPAALCSPLIRLSQLVQATHSPKTLDTQPTQRSVPTPDITHPAVPCCSAAPGLLPPSPAA